MTISQSIRQTRNGIVNLLNISGLPLDVMDLLLAEIKTAVHQQAEDAFNAETEKEESEEEVNGANES